MNLQLHPAILRAARLVLGATFVYLGIIKALDPVGFLKLVRQFDVPAQAPLLNTVAATLPWFEVFCGALLLLGIKRRATALWLLLLLGVFTALVIIRAVVLFRAGAPSFCAIRFDCGCGTGEILVCTKILENLALMLLACLVVAGSAPAASPHTPLTTSSTS